MMLKVCKQSGNLTDASTWYDVNNYSMPVYVTSGTSSYVNLNDADQYSEYFTPANATDTCVGVVIYVMFGIDETATVELMEGATSRASGQITAVNDSSITEGEATQGFYFVKFDTAYTYGNTNASTWRIKLSNIGTNNFYLRTDSGGNVGYMEVLDSSTAPAANDGFVISGEAGTAGTLTSRSVTVDGDLTVGSSGNYDGFYITKGGNLTWGTTQTSSNTITLDTDCDIWLTSSKNDEYALDMGTETNPLTADYIQKIIFSPTANGGQDGPGFVFGDYNYGHHNYNPPRLSVVGNHGYIRGTLADWRTTLASDAAAAQNEIVLTDDLELTADAEVYIGSTDGREQAEKIAVTSYDSGTKTVTLASNLSFAHSSGAQVAVYNKNASIESNTTSGWAHYSTGGWPSGYGVHSTLKEVQLINHHHIYGNSSNSYVDPSWTYIYFKPVSGPAITNMNVGNEITNSFMDMSNSSMYARTYQNWTNSIFVTVGDSKYYDIGNPSLTYTNCFFDGATPQLDSTNIRMIGCQNTASEITGIYLQNAIETTVKNCTIGPNNDLACFYLVGSDYMTVKIIDCELIRSGEVYIDSRYADLPAGAYVSFQNFDNNAGDHRIYSGGGVVRSTGAGLDDTTTKVVGENSIKLEPDAGSDGYLELEMSKSAVADSEVIFYGYVRKNSSYGSDTRPTIELTSEDGEIDTSYTITDVDDTWELFTLTGTVGSNNTTVRINLKGKSANAGAAAYFGGMRLVVGGVAFVVGNIWVDALPITDEPLTSPSFDSEFLANSVWNAFRSDHTTDGTTGKKLDDLIGGISSGSVG